MELFNIEGKKAIVTGGTRGLGYGMAEGLMEAGCRVLEPCYDFALEIPEEALGRAMTDIERFQGRFEAPFVENGMMVLRGSAPVASMRGYKIVGTAYTRGRGRLCLRLKGYHRGHFRQSTKGGRKFRKQRLSLPRRQGGFCKERRRV